MRRAIREPKKPEVEPVTVEEIDQAIEILKRVKEGLTNE
jgi:hypothetical protein